MALGQSIQQKLLQKLSPQQIQLMKLLQVPTASLEERIKEEIEENPALELVEDRHKDENTDDIYNEGDVQSEDNENGDSLDMSDYLYDDDEEIADYKTRDDNYGDDEEPHRVPLKTETSFYDHLAAQLGMLSLTEKEKKLAEHIIGSIDEDGYLRRDTPAIVDDLAFRQNIEASPREVEAIISMVQQFDPPGVCARDLPECLLLQLRRQKEEGKQVDTAIQAIKKYFEAFTKKHYDKIKKGLNLNDDELKEVIQQIIKLNPKPGGNIGAANKSENYIIPDFYILNVNGKLELSLNSRNAPELHISENYRDMMREYDRGAKKDKRQKEAVLFIKQK